MNRTRLVSLVATIAFVALLSGCAVNHAFISRATETETGTQGDSFSGFASLSENGRWVAFRSFSTNLVPGDTNGVYDVFVRDNQTKRVVRVSVASDGSQANGRSEWPSISNDGSRIAFASEATNLETGDTNGVRDVYIHDRDTDDDGIFDEANAVNTARISNNPFGTIGSRPSDRPQIHGDGFGVVYDSAATTAFDAHIDVYSTRFLGVIIWATSVISAPVGGGGPANASSYSASVNADGSVIAFTTDATNLFAGDTNGVSDVAVWDARGAPSGQPATIERVTGAIQGDGSSSEPSVSDSGGFVAFTSFATNLVPGDSDQFSDIFVADLDTGAITDESRTPAGFSPNNFSVDPAISADGSRVSFSSFATDLVAGDTNAYDDVFVRDRASHLTQIASTTTQLDLANGFSGRSALSDDGRYVAFDSTATNLATPDSNASAPDIFTRAAIVPRIDGVARLGTNASWVGWGTSTLRITGAGFGPGVAVDLGAGVTILGVHEAPTQIDVDISVATGSAPGVRNVVVDNLGALAIDNRSSTRVCSSCLTIQRWLTAPDLVVYPAPIVRVFSQNEFTPSTHSPLWPTQYVSPGEVDLFLVFGQFPQSGIQDLTLEQTVHGTVTCTNCLHVS